MHWIVETVKHYLLAWGYWAVILGLLVEDAGFPLPGETLLIFASFLAFKNHQLQLWLIILSGTAAATLGDNLGYWIGRKGGRPLLKRWKHLLHVNDEDIAAGEDLLHRRGDITIFFARFIWGMRMLAGPLAGVLRMEWRRFALFNFLGACVWVSAIAGAGYAFGSQFESLEHFFKKADIAIMVGVAVLGIYLWRRHKKKQRHSQGAPGRHHPQRRDPNQERPRRIG
ncbi:MAG TPA: DedA family protein [Terriglobales bacterium]|nr:DedA family protein [Terriglobales bacterium]